MKAAARSILLLVLCTASGLARAQTELKVGHFELYPYAYENEAGETVGYDIDVTKALCDAMEATCTPVFLETLDDRFTALEDGTVDMVVADVTWTTEREQLANFVRPFYYASGVGLYALEGTTLTGWDSITGKEVCALTGFYGNADVETAYGPTLVMSTTVEEMAAGLVSGSCVAAIVDTPGVSLSKVAAAMNPPAVTVVVEGAETLMTAPYGIIVRLNNTSLQDEVSGALTRSLLSAGSDSPIFAIEEANIVANGGTPLPDLVTLADAVTYLVAPPA